MSLTMGPNTGLLINGAPGEGHYSELIRMLRWDDFLRQPVVKGRVATLPTTGQAEGGHVHFHWLRLQSEPPSALVGNGCDHGYLGVHATQAGLAGAGRERDDAERTGQDLRVFRHGVGRAGGRYVGRAQRRKALCPTEQRMGRLGGRCRRRYSRDGLSGWRCSNWRDLRGRQ